MSGLSNPSIEDYRNWGAPAPPTPKPSGGTTTMQPPAYTPPVPQNNNWMNRVGRKTGKGGMEPSIPGMPDFSTMAAAPMNFDLPMWQGPYGAPLTNLQLDSMGALEKMLGADPVAQTTDIQSAIQQAIGAGTGPNAPGTDTSGFMQNFGEVFGQAGQPAQSFDLTPTFEAARGVFESGLEDTLAGAREEFSGLGLDPGSSTRTAGIARTEADARNRFNLGMQDVARQSFESAQNRGLQQLGLQANLLPMELEGAQIPFQEAMQSYLGGLQGQQTGAGALPSLLQAFNNPAILSRFGFDVGEQARGGAQGELDRMMEEYARTQGGLFPMMASMFAGPQNQVAYGPSDVSQIGNVVAGLAPLLAEIPWEDVF